RKAIDSPWCIPAFYDHVLAFDIAERAQRFSERAVRGNRLCTAEVAQEADTVHFPWLLRLGARQRNRESQGSNAQRDNSERPTAYHCVTSHYPRFKQVSPASILTALFGTVPPNLRSAYSGNASCVPRVSLP